MKVKLKDVVEALDFANHDTEYYYNRNTEEYIPLPGHFEIEEYSMMEEFINDVTVGRAQSKLEDAMLGRGAFRRFKDTVYDLGLEQKWYKYRDEAYKKIAREWCERNQIDIVE